MLGEEFTFGLFRPLSILDSRFSQLLHKYYRRTAGIRAFLAKKVGISCLQLFNFFEFNLCICNLATECASEGFDHQ